MPFHRLIVNALALLKLAERSISLEEVAQVLKGTYLVTPNRAARVDGSLLVIGVTTAGRMLTLVLDPYEDTLRWRLMTGWDATQAQVRIFRNSR